jgi:hypothetical protein
MAEQYRALSIRATLASDDYTRGAQAIAAANREMSQSAGQAGSNVVQFETKISSAADGFTKLVNRIDPAAKAARQFQQDLLTLNRAIETGKTSGDAAVNTYVLLSSKLGLVASETQIAEQNLGGLAQVVAAGNERMLQYAATVDRLAASYRELAAEARAAQAADIAQGNFNRFMGVGQPNASAASSAAVFEEQLRQQEEAQRRAEQIAQLRAQQAGGNFAADVNSRLGVNGFGTDARASAAVFEEEARAAEQLTARVTALKAAIDPVGTSWAAMNAQIAEYNDLLQRGMISTEQFAQAEALARQRHEQLSASLAATPGVANDNNAQFRRQNLGYQAFDIGQGLASGLPLPMILAQQGPQIAQQYAMTGGIKALLGDVGTIAGGVASSLGGVGLAFAAAGAAALGFYEITKTHSRDAADVLKQEQDAIKRIRDLWGEAADQRSKYGRDSSASASFGLDTSISELVKKLEYEAKPGLFGGNNISAAVLNAITRYRPDTGLSTQEFHGTDLFKKLQTDFDSFYKDTLNGKETVIGFVRELEEIGKRSDNAGIKAIVADAVAALKPYKDLADALREARIEHDRLFNDIGPSGFLLSQGTTNTRDQGNYDAYLQAQKVSLDRMDEQYRAQIAELMARSPVEKSNAARQTAEAQHLDEDAPTRAKRIELAATQALIAAEHDLRLAKEERIRQSDQELARAQYELGLIGQSVAERNRLMAAYQAESAIRAQAARDHVAADEAEIASAKKKAAEIADINAQISLGKMSEDQGYDAQRLQLEANLIGATADQRARATAALEAEIRLKQQGIDLSSQAAQGYINEAEALAQARVQIERQQAAYQSWQQAGSSAIDTLVTGTGSLKDRLKQMANDMLTWLQQMAIANPLKNALFNTNLPTLTDLFSGKPQVPGASATSTAMMNVTASVVNLNGGIPGFPAIPGANTGGLASLIGAQTPANPLGANYVRPSLPVAANQNLPTLPLTAANQNTPANMLAYQQAISRIESGSYAGNYNILGPTTRTGDYAVGRYQVMASNVPSWSQTWYGQKLTADQFRANPAAQDAVFNGQFGSYINRYGNTSDAASAWFTGRPLSQGANASDINGTTGNQYVNQFNTNLAKLSQTSSSAAKDVSTLGDNSMDAGKSILDAFKAPAGPTATPPVTPQLPTNYFPPAPTSGLGIGGLFSSLFKGIFGLFGFADGTDYAPGGLAWVGERGRELVRMPRGAQVIPNHRLNSAGGGGGGRLKVEFVHSFDHNGNFETKVRSISHEVANDVAPTHAAAAVEVYNREVLFNRISEYQGDQYARGS